MKIPERWLSIPFLPVLTNTLRSSGTGVMINEAILMHYLSIDAKVPTSFISPYALFIFRSPTQDTMLHLALGSLLAPFGWDSFSDLPHVDDLDSLEGH